MQNESWRRALTESRPWTREEAARAMAACEASGMTTSEFARRCGTTGGRLQYWRKRLRALETRGEGRLVPVQVVARGQARVVERAPGRVVVQHGEVRVEMEGMAAEWVATLIHLLRESAG
jgi:transposase-like protein